MVHLAGLAREEWESAVTVLLTCHLHACPIKALFSLRRCCQSRRHASSQTAARLVHPSPFADFRACVIPPSIQVTSRKITDHPFATQTSILSTLLPLFRIRYRHRSDLSVVSPLQVTPCAIASSAQSPSALRQTLAPFTLSRPRTPILSSRPPRPYPTATITLASRSRRPQ
jgi:hypothetical protein